MLPVAIALLIIFGIALLIIEFLVLPGITIAFIGGVILMSLGVYISFRTYGSDVGTYVLIGTVILFIAALVYALRSKTWKRLALKSEIVSKVNTIHEFNIHVGDKGVAVTKLSSIGKVKINDTIVEAKSLGMYIEENTDIEVVEVSKSDIIVKPLK
jgi:membrane-bound ClpP family serine protease